MGVRDLLFAAPFRRNVCKLATPRGEGFLYRVENASVVCFEWFTAISIRTLYRVERPTRAMC